jgi:hypothetical protein
MTSLFYRADGAVVQSIPIDGHCATRMVILHRTIAVFEKASGGIRVSHAVHNSCLRWEIDVFDQFLGPGNGAIVIRMYVYYLKYKL